MGGETWASPASSRSLQTPGFAQKLVCPTPPGGPRFASGLAARIWRKIAGFLPEVDSAEFPVPRRLLPPHHPTQLLLPTSRKRPSKTPEELAVDSALALACHLSCLRLPRPSQRSQVPRGRTDCQTGACEGAAARSCFGKEMVALGPWADRMTAAETPAEDRRPADSLRETQEARPFFCRGLDATGLGPRGSRPTGKRRGGRGAGKRARWGVSHPGEGTGEGHPERWPLLAGPRTPGLERRARARALRPAGPAVIGLYPPARCHRIDFRSLG